MLSLFTQGGTAGAILILALIIASGLYLSRFKLKGISLGTTWILFMGILLGHLGLRVNPTMLSFVKDFGLILFVFAIGLQVGPGFFHSRRATDESSRCMPCLVGGCYHLYNTFDQR